MKSFKAQKKTNWKKVILIAIAVVVLLILLIGLMAFLYVDSILSGINRPDPESETTLSQEQIDQILEDPEVGGVGDVDVTVDTNLVTDEDQLVSSGDKIINIMLIGQDTNGSHNIKLSDTMILCTVNVEKKTMTLTSFMRDMYVKLPDYEGKHYGSSRINTCYALGGMGMLDQCLYENFGVEVDHNIEVSFTSFPLVVDLLGGIDMELTGAEASHLNKEFGWALTSGMNHLDGEQTLQFARIRKIDSDFQRTERQRKVITTLVEKCKGMSLTELDALIRDLVPLVTTDMENSDIYGYMASIIPILPDLTINTLQIPADGAWYGKNIGTEEERQDVLVPILEENRAILKEAIGAGEE